MDYRLIISAFEEDVSNAVISRAYRELSRDIAEIAPRLTLDVICRPSLCDNDNPQNILQLMARHSSVDEFTQQGVVNEQYAIYTFHRNGYHIRHRAPVAICADGDSYFARFSICAICALLRRFKRRKRRQVGRREQCQPNARCAPPSKVQSGCV